MKNIELLKQKRASLITEGRSLTELAAKENRNLKPEERTKIDELIKQADELGQDIEREERLQSLDMAHAPKALVTEDHKKEKRSAFFKYIRSGKSSLNFEERAMVEDTNGLLMVPEDLDQEVYRELPQLNVIRQLANIRQTTRDKVARRSITEVSMGWGKLEAGALITETTPTPGKDYIYVEDLTGLVKVGRDELQDSDDILAGIIANSFAIARANAEARAFILGTGHSNQQPDGVTLDTTIISTYTDLDTADTVVPDDVIDIEYGLPAQYKNGASFIWHPTTEAMLRKVKATSNYLWVNPNGPAAAVAPKSFDGYPVYNSSDMIVPASTNTDRSIVALFGNWKMGYTILDHVGGMTVQRLDELYAEEGMIGFLCYFRVGGGVVRPNAFRALDNNT
jgi:HK97 family phage major capsid protein